MQMQAGNGADRYTRHLRRAAATPTQAGPPVPPSALWTGPGRYIPNPKLHFSLHRLSSALVSTVLTILTTNMLYEQLSVVSPKSCRTAFAVPCRPCVVRAHRSTFHSNMYVWATREELEPQADTKQEPSALYIMSKCAVLRRSSDVYPPYLQGIFENRSQGATARNFGVPCPSLL
jgi:hypothetical protein